MTMTSEQDFAQASAPLAGADIQERLEAVLGDYPSLRLVFGAYMRHGAKAFSVNDRGILEDYGLLQDGSPDAVIAVWQQRKPQGL